MANAGDPWGMLTHQQIYECLPSGTLLTGLATWVQLRSAIKQLPAELQNHICAVAAAKQDVRKHSRRERDGRYQAQRRLERRQQRNASDTSAFAQPPEPFRISQSSAEYLSILTEEQSRSRVAMFIDHTGNEALSSCVCVVCAREMLRGEG